MLWLPEKKDQMLKLFLRIAGWMSTSLRRAPLRVLASGCGALPLLLHTSNFVGLILCFVFDILETFYLMNMDANTGKLTKCLGFLKKIAKRR